MKASAGRSVADADKDGGALVDPALAPGRLLRQALAELDDLLVSLPNEMFRGPGWAGYCSTRRIASDSPPRDGAVRLQT